jgi:serine O-acetyltransferase
MLLKNLRDEIDATLARDPAARSRLEVVLCYPGFQALLYYRLAHWLWQRGWHLCGRFVSHVGRVGRRCWARSGSVPAPAAAPPPSW